MVKIPIDKPQMVNVDYAGKILTPEELKAVVGEVNDGVKRDFEGMGVLDKPVEINEDGEVCYVPINGTILFGNVVSNHFPGVYVSTRAEKERAIKDGLSFEGVYSYDSLCLGGVDLGGGRLNGRELDFACRLMRHSKLEKKAGIVGFQERVLEAPALIPMSGIFIEPDKDYGLHFAINPKTQVVYDKGLKQGGNFDDCDFKTGVPILGQGGRTFYPNKGNLAGVGVGGGGVLADDGSWSNSGCNSRVVLTDTR